MWDTLKGVFFFICVCVCLRKAQQQFNFRSTLMQTQSPVIKSYSTNMDTVPRKVKFGLTLHLKCPRVSFTLRAFDFYSVRVSKKKKNVNTALKKYYDHYVFA